MARKVRLVPENCEICLQGDPDRTVIFESPLVPDPVRIEICDECERAFTKLIVDRYRGSLDQMDREVAAAKALFGLDPTGDQYLTDQEAFERYPPPDRQA